MLQPLKQARRTLTEYFGQLILTNYARGHLPLTVDQAVLPPSTCARYCCRLFSSSFLTQLSNVFVPLSPAPADTPHFNFQLHALLKPDALVLSGSLPCVPRHVNSLRGLEGHPRFINFSSYSIPNWTENFSRLGNH